MTSAIELGDCLSAHVTLITATIGFRILILPGAGIRRSLIDSLAMTSQSREHPDRSTLVFQLWVALGSSVGVGNWSRRHGSSDTSQTPEIAT